MLDENRRLSGGLNVSAPIDAARNIRVDVYRGLAILLMFFAHALGLMGEINWDRVGISGVAEVFVCLSGYVAGLSNPRNVIYRATRRAGQLYIFQIVTAVAFIATCVYFGQQGSPIIIKAGIDKLFTEPGLAVRDLSLLKLQPYVNDILPLFIVLSIISPLIRAASNRPALLLCVSIVVYIAAPALNRPMYRIGMHLFNPLSWQLVYVVGLLFATTDWFVRLSRPGLQSLLVGLSVALLTLGLFARSVHSSPLWFGHRIPLFGLANELTYGPWSSKHNAGPLRLLHFGAAAYLTVLLTRGTGDWAAVWFLRQLSLLGRWSLHVYCAGAVLTAVLWGFAMAKSSQPLQLFVLTMCCVLIQWGFAAYLDLGRVVPRAAILPQARV